MAAPNAPMRVIRVLEFYSGIGGMHFAIKGGVRLQHFSPNDWFIKSYLDATVIAAVDINDVANKVYKYNFPHANLMQRNIQSITVEEFDEMEADMFLMSPPCQPFTRVGLKGDLQDPRTQSFLHLLQTLPRLARMPSYILVENVQGFEGSNSRAQLVKTLENCCYDYQ
ncbi:tRNA (cytosine-5-)-methyltransferase-like, partial [Acanthaster planci]|uniref:tRNA (Cytosine-5-)-methyltransferase-like n=1 Tax=Acanthaster planci TaxID=133434 RepID=A0A8B7ZM01_ACAPL